MSALISARQSVGHACHGRQIVRVFCQRSSPFAGNSFTALSRHAAQGCLSRGGRRRQRSVQTFAAWGKDIEWTAVKVKQSYKAAEGLQTVILDIGALGLAYQKGGQFLQLKVGDSSPGFYAIASGPDPTNQAVVELLIKPAGDTAERVCSAPEGSELQASPVMGKGFPVDRCPPDAFPTLLIFATGSGISPIRSLIESDALQTDQRKDVRLYYGTLGPDHTAFRDRIPAWEAQGIKVIPVYSETTSGYVQDVYAKDPVPDGSSTCAVLVGQKEMCQAVTELLLKQGVSKDNVLLNF